MYRVYVVIKWKFSTMAQLLQNWNLLNTKLFYEGTNWIKKKDNRYIGMMVKSNYLRANVIGSNLMVFIKQLKKKKKKEEEENHVQ